MPVRRAQGTHVPRVHSASPRSSGPTALVLGPWWRRVIVDPVHALGGALGRGHGGPGRRLLREPEGPLSKVCPPPVRRCAGSATASRRRVPGLAALHRIRVRKPLPGSQAGQAARRRIRVALSRYRVPAQGGAGSTRRRDHQATHPRRPRLRCGMLGGVGHGPVAPRLSPAVIATTGDGGAPKQAFEFLTKSSHLIVFCSYCFL
ncbi:hypothetical protein U9M48_033247 [Paspalum notatum var. saurae]|uniref:Uncharacterized protein n=1 Tax=Paspalum notatum var. saurae TaxID=547442 RepID=A0AAQ3U7U6_PASNO